MSEKEEIRSGKERYFTERLKAKHHSHLNQTLHVLQFNHLPTEDAVEQERPFGEEEVEKAIFMMAGDDALDDFAMVIFQRYWNCSKEKLWK